VRNLGDRNEVRGKRLDVGRNYINSPEFEEWLHRNDPDAIKVETAATLAQMHTAITITPMEVLRISEASDQLAVERDWIMDAQRIVRERQEKEIAEEALRGLVQRRAEYEIRKARNRKLWLRVRIVLIWIACLGFAAWAVTR
jgi:hypothetical protein